MEEQLSLLVNLLSKEQIKVSLDKMIKKCKRRWCGNNWFSMPNILQVHLKTRACIRMVIKMVGTGLVPVGV
jgi:hypothetical protein